MYEFIVKNSMYFQESTKFEGEWKRGTLQIGLEDNGIISSQTHMHLQARRCTERILYTNTNMNLDYSLIYGLVLR